MDLNNTLLPDGHEQYTTVPDRFSPQRSSRCFITNFASNSKEMSLAVMLMERVVLAIHVKTYSLNDFVDSGVVTEKK